MLFWATFTDDLSFSSSIIIKEKHLQSYSYRSLWPVCTERCTKRAKRLLALVVTLRVFWWTMSEWFISMAPASGTIYSSCTNVSLWRRDHGSVTIKFWPMYHATGTLSQVVIRSSTRVRSRKACRATISFATISPGTDLRRSLISIQNSAHSCSLEALLDVLTLIKWSLITYKCFCFEKSRSSTRTSWVLLEWKMTFTLVKKMRRRTWAQLQMNRMNCQ